MEILDKTGLSVLWNTIKDKFTLKSSLSKVATSGSYNDLSNKPAIPSVAGYLPLSGGTMTGALKIKGTAASKPLTVRGIVGCLEDGVTYGELHLQYGANAAIKLGNTAAYSISADGSQYTGNAATATTASAVAWANVTGKPSTFAPSAHNHGLNSSTFAKNVPDSTTGDWSSVGGNSGFLLMSLRSGLNAPSWLENNYSAGIAFGGSDTKGVVSVGYTSPSISIAGGNGTAPRWNIKLVGTSAKQYNLDSMPYAASAGTASAVAWSNVTGKPSTFTPASHTHDWGSITGKPSTYTPASHTHSWGNISNKPSLMEANEFSSDNIEALLKKIQGLSPRMGSAQITKDTRIASTWWSFLYIPHRTGIGGDNGNYGTLLLFPMTGNGSSYIVRSSSAGVVSDIRKIYTSSDKPTKSDIGLGSVDNTSDANKSVKYATTAGSANSVAWGNVSGKPTMPTNITATAATIVSISGSTIKVNASLDGYKTPGEYNIYGTSNGDYAKMYVQSGIADTFNGTRVITQTIRVTISHNTYAEVCDVTRQYKSNAWSAWTIMYLGND